MHLWLITSSYPRAPEESLNAGVLARDLALSLLQLGHRVTVVTPNRPGGIVLDPGLEMVRLPWFRPTVAMADLSARAPVDLFRILSFFILARPALRRALAREQPDGTVALWALPSGIFARWVKRWSGVPYVVWLLGSDVWKAPSYPFGTSLLRKIIEDSNAAYADGSELAAEAIRLTGQTVEFLPSIRRLPPPPASLPEPVDVLFIGRYHPNKAPDLLIEAFARVNRARPGAKLRLHGEGTLRSGLERQVERQDLRDVVTVAGPLSAVGVAGAMASAKVLAIPSRIESIPLILGDAMQAGLPVVASAVGDMGELVRRHKLGLTVPPNDPEALAAALLAMLDSPGRLQAPSLPPSITAERTAETLVARLIQASPVASGDKR
jgi:glycosyltransferase involved in cell wall biosynthesis